MSWNYRLNIKQYLNQEDDSDTLTIAKNVAQEIRKVDYWIFEELPNHLIQEVEQAIERIPDDKDYHELAFNRVLEQIYDVADEQRVWLGL